jgi:hypothetical protein
MYKRYFYVLMSQLFNAHVVQVENKLLKKLIKICVK